MHVVAANQKVTASFKVVLLKDVRVSYSAASQKRFAPRSFPEQTDIVSSCCVLGFV